MREHSAAEPPAVGRPRGAGAPTARSAGKISFLLPAYNEAENLRPVIEEIRDVLTAMSRPFEIVVIDDGSTDDTPYVMDDLASEYAEVISLRMRRNVGKSPALAAGLKSVTGRIVVLMDADGQDNPGELPRMLSEIDGGMDLLTGRRSVRQDRFIKRHTSRLFNATTSRVTGVEGRDFNSGFKVMRREVADSLELYGELHRYIPVLAHWDGFKVGEVEVDHRTRLHGTSKFGSARFWRGCLDLVTVRFLTSYANRPLHLFGSLGAAVSLLGIVVLAWLFVAQQFFGRGIGGRPALITGVLLVIVGVQFLSLGLIAQLLVHLSKKRDPRDWLDTEPPRVLRVDEAPADLSGPVAASPGGAGPRGPQPPPATPSG